MKILILASLLGSVQAFAWGPTGHRAVGEVATSLLDADVALKIQQLLDGGDLARAATWPDEIKSEPETYRYTYTWHYTDWPDEMHDHSEEASSGQLLKSISEQLLVLKDPKATKEKKAFALKFVTHLVGDLHMPLHVGNGIDQGGNLCKVYFHKVATNLHAVWDEDMINFNKLSFTEFARFVKQALNAQNFAEWKKGTVVDWALESKQLRNTIYPDEAKAYCRKEVTDAEMPRLGYEYSYKFMPIVEKRVLQAGVRLAKLLNESL